MSCRPTCLSTVVTIHLIGNVTSLSLSLQKVGSAWLERTINTLSIRRPQPYNTNPQNERREGEDSRRQKGIILPQIDDVQGHTQAHPSYETSTTHYTVQQFKLCISNRETYCRTVLQNGRTKPRKHLPRSNLSWNTCQDILKIPRP